MAATAVLENSKIAIPLQPFNRFRQNLAHWRVCSLRTVPYL